MTQNARLGRGPRATRLFVSALLLALPAIAHAGAIDIHILPTAQTVTVGQSFDVTIVADVEDPILGFGFELLYDETLFALEDTQVGQAFLPTRMSAQGAFSALAYPSGAAGEELVLGSASLVALTTGVGNIGIAIPANTAVWGFAETAVAAFATWEATPATVTVSPPGGGGGEPPIPEPTTALLIAAGFLTLARRVRTGRAIV